MNKPLFKRQQWGQLVTMVFLLPGAAALADPIAYAGFDIETGELDLMSGATSFGWDAEWFSADPETFDPVHGVSDTGLTYEGLATVGNAFEFANEANYLGDATFRVMTNKYTGAASSGSVWVSALIQPQIAGDPAGGGFFQLALSDGASPENKAYVGIDWAGEQYSAGGERVRNVINSDVDIASGETVFVVLQVDFDAEAGEDAGLLRFWINPDPAATEPGAPVGEAAFEESLAFDRVMLYIGNHGPSVGEEGIGADYIGTLVDEIRLGETWADVSPAGGDDPGPTDPDPIDEALAFFELDEDAEGDFWLNVAGLGWVHAESYPWLYSYSELSWLYSYETSATFSEGSWFWDLNRNNWIHTNGTDYPWVYVHGTGWVDSSAEAGE